MEAAEEFAGAGDAEAVGQQQRIVVVEVVERGVELAITFELRRVAFVDAGQIESAGFVEQPRLAGQPLGARGLRSICEAIMMDTMFDIPSTDTRKFTVTLPYAKKKIEKANILELKQVG